MFFINCIFENVIFLLFLRIYDVIKIIVMSCFLLIAYLKIPYFLLFLRIRNSFHKIIMTTCFLLIAYLKMTYLCIFYYTIFIDPTIEIIRVTSPFNEVFIFVFFE